MTEPSSRTQKRQLPPATVSIEHLKCLDNNYRDEIDEAMVELRRLSPTLTYRRRSTPGFSSWAPPGESPPGVAGGSQQRRTHDSSGVGDRKRYEGLARIAENLSDTELEELLRLLL